MLSWRKGYGDPVPQHTIREEEHYINVDSIKVAKTSL